MGSKPMSLEQKLRNRQNSEVRALNPPPDPVKTPEQNHGGFGGGVKTPAVSAPVSPPRPVFNTTVFASAFIATNGDHDQLLIARDMREAIGMMTQAQLEGAERIELVCSQVRVAPGIFGL